jgi:hypothetical protein
MIPGICFVLFSSGCGKQLHDALQPSDGWWAGELTGNWHIFRKGARVGRHPNLMQESMQPPSLSFGARHHPEKMFHS